jgi:hypothetical protein
MMGVHKDSSSVNDIGQQDGIDFLVPVFVSHGPEERLNSRN